MTKSEISTAILKIFNEQFEIEQPGLDDDLREVYEFDSIDAIELLREIEILLSTQLTREEKKAAMDIRTINHIIDYVDDLALQRSAIAG
jgi:acyl carrier protein